MELRDRHQRGERRTLFELEPLGRSRCRGRSSIHRMLVRNHLDRAGPACDPGAFSAGERAAPKVVGQGDIMRLE